MAHLLSDRSDLRRAFYRLTGTSEADSALSEHDEEPGATVQGFLTQGLWEAQSWVINMSAPDRWVGREEITSWTTGDDGHKWVALPDDFLRLVGDYTNSALYYPKGDRWGALIDPRHKTMQGDRYYLENDRLYLTRLANPPSTLSMEYYYRHPELTSDDPETAGGTIDFPVEDRMLIVALAANEFADHPQFPGTDQAKLRIARAVKRWQERIHQRARRSRQPRRVGQARALGNRFFSRGR